METKAATNIQESLDMLRARALDRLTIYMMISVCFLLVGYFYRLSDIDWKNIYYLQIICFIGVALVPCYRKRLSYKNTIISYLGLGLILAVAEFIGLGLTGMGDVTSLFCIMLSLFYLDRRSTAIVTILVLIIYGAVFYQYASEDLLLSETDLALLSLPSAWVGTLIANGSFFLIIGMSIYYLQDQSIRLLREIAKQKETIEQQQQHIEYLANHDALTGLPSLRIANDRIESVLELANKKKHMAVLLFLDLDGFKEINDTYGHEAGDELLKRVAGRISLCIRSSDTACRVGGDEFLIIMQEVNNRKDIESLCQRLIKEISRPFAYQKTTLLVGVSIGAACSLGYPVNSKILRHKADELMYKVKKSGKNNYLISMDCPNCHYT